ncbi:MAG: ABC transporter substrate-binding protein [Anaerolineales bacterium]|nr:ABC transporter substrate-binding protein [Anaerolineales bacterium]
MKPERQIKSMINRKSISREFRGPLVFKASFYLAVFLVIGLFIQACTGAGSTPTPIEEFPSEPAVQHEGVLRVAVQPIVQTDPAFISSDPEVLVANHVYDYMVDVTSNNTISPRLATEWKVSDDGLTYEFTLAEGVKFHDGSPLTAGDVAWTFNRLRDPEVGSATVDLYSNIADITATEPNVVTFVLAEPNPFFLYDLSDNHALVLKSGSEEPSTEFNGTGPFKVVEYSPEDRLVMAANDDYFVLNQPKLAGLEFIFFNDQTAQVEALRSGQVDLVMVISTDLFTSLEGEDGFTLFEVPTNAFDLVRLRSDRAPGDDPRIIQALKLATDREAIYQLVLQGYGEVGRDSPIGPLYSQYYTEETPLPERDVEAAKSLLAEAGYPDGLELTLHTPDTGNRPNLAVVLKEQWAEAGVEVDVVVEPESIYYGEDGWLEVDLGITGWGSRPYPQFYLDVMLTCGAKWNESHYCDQEFDELAAVAGTTMDEADRSEAYAEIQRILIERGPVMIPYFFAQLGAISDDFNGFQMKAFPGRSDFRPVTYAGE